VTNMSYTALPESLGNVPLLRLYNPQPFEDRICHQLQVEWGKEELNCGGPMLVELNMADYIQTFFTVVTTYHCHFRLRLN
jgi:hypothetical protein